MKSLITLWAKVASDYATFTGTTTSDDLRTVVARTEREGLSFLTITLPGFGKQFEAALESGKFSPAMLTSFRWRSGLPVFLQGFTERTFSRCDGRLLDDPCVESIRAVRQLTLLFSKMENTCSPRRTAKAIQGFIECERDVAYQSAHERSSDLAALSRIGAALFSRTLHPIEKKILDLDLIPAHGPGAVSDGFTGNKKWLLNTWTDRLERSFPYSGYCVPNARYSDVLLDDVTFLEPGAEPPVKVVTVPKTAKTPRIIAIESTAMQFAQQALRREVYNEIPRNRYLRCMLDFRDQEPNQLMARNGSLSGELGTLDLSEASDRVSFAHVRAILSRNPVFLDAVDDCRSRRARVGDEVITLSKFASMGSALTFPLEAMVFLTVIFRALEKTLNRTITMGNVESILKEYSHIIRVYGDDIIVPVDLVPSVIRELATFGYVVNRDKSFWNGRFRESCGRDYYAGEDVSVLKYRLESLPSRLTATDSARVAEFRNQCYTSGLWKTAAWLDVILSRSLRYYPVKGDTSPVIGRTSFLGYNAERVGGRYQEPQVRGTCVHPVIPRSNLSGRHALLKCFSTPFNEDDKHLQQSGRPRSAKIRTGWYRAY